MKYALIICDDESVPESAAELARRPEHIAWVAYLEDHGIALLNGARLRPSGDATTVRSRVGEVLVSDGPFIETKEQVGGFAVLDCADLDAAIEAAARHPWAAHGVVEVRPLWEE
jgi:hypothetical protein